MEARLPITLKRAVRYFIIRERSVEEAGNLIIDDEIHLESTLRICIDFQLRDVALFTRKDCTYCVIISEIGVPNLLNKLRNLKNFKIIQ